jgi:hypothetical protein
LQDFPAICVSAYKLFIYYYILIYYIILLLIIIREVAIDVLMREQYLWIQKITRVYILSSGILRGLNISN